MKQLLILSGKGGTGKTTIASAFIRLAQAKAYADCDVDAPNLHLVNQQINKARKTNYYGLPKAQINIDLCIQCDMCRLNCRFDAIVFDHEYRVESYACEGCSVCEYVCPTKAVSLTPSIAGELMLYENEDIFSTAQLKMGSGTTGKLVSEVKKQLKASVDRRKDLIPLTILDGSPGIGCPVIASLSGVDMVLIVTEPSISGISDMERIINTARIFHPQIAVCVNKYDTNIENTENIKAFCQKNKITFVGTIPYDAQAVKAVNNKQSIVDVICPSGFAVMDVFDKTIELLYRNQ
jgi:MinD superfamily P-loop ATPase